MNAIEDSTKFSKNNIIRTLIATDGDSLDQNTIRHKAIDFLNKQDFPEGTMLTIIVTHDPRKLPDALSGGRASFHKENIKEGQ